MVAFKKIRQFCPEDPSIYWFRRQAYIQENIYQRIRILFHDSRQHNAQLVNDFFIERPYHAEVHGRDNVIFKDKDISRMGVGMKEMKFKDLSEDKNSLR